MYAISYLCGRQCLRERGQMWQHALESLAIAGGASQQASKPASQQASMHWTLGTMGNVAVEPTPSATRGHQCMHAMQTKTTVHVHGSPVRKPGDLFGAYPLASPTPGDSFWGICGGYLAIP